MRTAASVAVAALLMAVPSAAQDRLSGTWQGHTNAGTSIQLDLTAKGTALTGTLTRDGRKTSISDGKVSKDSFAFKATVNDQAEGFSGERSGEDEIKVWLDRQGREKAIVLARLKPPAKVLHIASVSFSVVRGQDR